MASRSNFAAPLLLAVVTGLIVYVSLYPFRFARARADTRRSAAGTDLGAGVARRHVQQRAAVRAVRLLRRAADRAALGPTRRHRRRRVRGRRAVAGPRIAAGIRGASRLEPHGPLAERGRGIASAPSSAPGSTRLGKAWRRSRTARARSANVAFAILVLWLIERLWPLIPDPGLRQLKFAVRPLLTPRIEWIAAGRVFRRLARGCASRVSPGASDSARSTCS